MGFSWRSKLLPLAWLALTACQVGAPLSVQQAGDRLVFSVDDGSGRKLCIRSVYVYPGGPAGTEPLWHIEEVQRVECRRAIEYGQVPSGFATDGPGPDLQPGGAYRAAVLGPGFNEVVDFIAK